MMKIFIKEDENIETIEVDQNSKVDDIYNQINRKYNYLLSFKSHILEKGYLIDQYNIKQNDYINLLVLGPYKIKIYCKVGKTEIIVTQIFYDEPINILMKKLNLNDEGLRIIYRGISYRITESKKFKELGIKDGSRIIFIKPSIAG